MTPAVVQAIAHVESRGSDGAIRFEPHIYLKRRPDLLKGLKRLDGTEGVIPYTATGPKKPWDKDPTHTSKAAFELAFALDRDAAVEATSFGRFQVLGLWLKKIYAGDPLVGFVRWRENPAAVNDALLVAWFKDNKPALAAAKQQDWRTFARIYNGPGRVDLYAGLLQKAHETALA